MGADAISERGRGAAVAGSSLRAPGHLHQGLGFGNQCPAGSERAIRGLGAHREPVLVDVAGLCLALLGISAGGFVNVTLGFACAQDWGGFYLIEYNL